MNITCLGGVGEIGGNKILVENDGAKVFLDFGRSMSKAGKFYEEFIQIRSKSGLLDLLKLGILPKVDGVYPKHLLDITTLGSEVDAKSKLPWDKASDYWKNGGIKPYDKEKGINGVFVSHVHFDHLQDVSFIHKDIPIFSTETTRVMAKAITDVSKSSVDNQFFEVNDKIEIREKNESYKTVFPGALEYKDEPDTEEIKDLKTGYTFTREVKTVKRKFITKKEGEIGSLNYRIIPVGHSVPGACSVLLTTQDKKTILYTGDIRFHGKNEPSLDEYVGDIGAEKIDIMLCEGTRIDSEKKLTEDDVYQDMLEQATKTEGLILVDFGWKDTTRFETIAKVAKETGRTLVVNPKIAYLLYELFLMDSEKYSDPTKMDGVKIYKKRRGGLLYSKADYEKFEAGYLDHWGKNKAKKDNNIVRISEKLGIGGDSKTETQELTEDEKMAWFLAVHHIENGVTSYAIRENSDKYILMFSFWDANGLFDLSNEDGVIPSSRYIRASCEPFNDEMEIDEEKLMNWLNKFGISYVTEEENKNHFKRAHVSGHASRLELKEIIKRINPGIIIPIHTQHPDEFHKIVEEIGTGIKVIKPEYGKTLPF